MIVLVSDSNHNTFLCHVSRNQGIFNIYVYTELCASFDRSFGTKTVINSWIKWFFNYIIDLHARRLQNLGIFNCSHATRLNTTCSIKNLEKTKYCKNFKVVECFVYPMLCITCKSERKIILSTHLSCKIWPTKIGSIGRKKVSL